MPIKMKALRIELETGSCDFNNVNWTTKHFASKRNTFNLSYGFSAHGSERIVT